MTNHRPAPHDAAWLEDSASRAEAAAYLKLNPRTLCRWERLEVGPPVVRLSRNDARYPWAGLRAFLAASLKMAPGLREAAIKAGLPVDEV
jgi:hypothetical protein